MSAQAALESWTEEMRSAHLYGVIAEAEAGTPRERLFRSLANEAESQAAIWARLAREQGASAPAAFTPDVRTRLVERLVRRYGARKTRGILAAMKVRGLSVYTHAQPGHPRPTSIEDMKRRHRGVASGGNLRAAVFGVNDGLISNMSLILGVAGGDAGHDQPRGHLRFRYRKRRVGADAAGPFVFSYGAHRYFAAGEDWGRKSSVAPGTL